MAIGRSCSIEYLAPAIVAETDTATAVERCVIGRRAINDVAVTRDSDGRLLAELRAQPAADGSSHEQFAGLRPAPTARRRKPHRADPSSSTRSGLSLSSPE